MKLPEGFHSVNCHLCVQDAAAALEFYCTAFGGEEILRLVGPGEMIAHAEVRIGDTVVMLAEENPDWGSHAPPTLGGTPVRLNLFVDDVDAFASRAVAAGAELVEPISDRFYGERSGRLRDPLGHQWIVSQHLEEMTQEEMQRRYDEFLAEMMDG